MSHVYPPLTERQNDRNPGGRCDVRGEPAGNPPGQAVVPGVFFVVNGDLIWLCGCHIVAQSHRCQPSDSEAATPKWVCSREIRCFGAGAGRPGLVVMDLSLVGLARSTRDEWRQTRKRPSRSNILGTRTVREHVDDGGSTVRRRRHQPGLTGTSTGVLRAPGVIEAPSCQRSARGSYRPCRPLLAPEPSGESRMPMS